jgi:hypothetical protein
MAKHDYHGGLNSRSQRTRSKLRAVQPIDLVHLEILPRGMPCAICGTRVRVVRVPKHTLCDDCTKTEA